MLVKVMKVKLDRGALTPTRAHKTDAGEARFASRGSVVIDIELPNGTVGFLKSKSGLNDITSDVGYTGSIKVKRHSLARRWNYAARYLFS